MSVTANLVVGSDGSTTLHGDSRALSTAADRNLFLSQRRERSCIIIGGRTALTKDYDSSPCPVIVLSHSRPTLLDRNAKALWWNLAPTEAIAQAKIEFGENVGVEAGPTLLLTLVKLILVDVLDLSVTPVSGGEGQIDIQLLLSYFGKVESSMVTETIFYHCSAPKR